MTSNEDFGPAVKALQSCFASFDRVVWCGEVTPELTDRLDEPVPFELRQVDCGAPRIVLYDAQTGAFLFAEVAARLNDFMASVNRWRKNADSNVVLNFAIVYSSRKDIAMLDDLPWGTFACFINEPGHNIFFE